MLDLSPDKIFVLALVALVVLGPHRLPQAARTLGRLMGQLRALTGTVQDEVREALHEPQEAFNSAFSEFRPSDIRRNLRQSVIDTIAPPADGADPAGSQGIPAPPVGAAGGAAGAGGGAPAPAWNGHPDDPSLN